MNERLGTRRVRVPDRWWRRRPRAQLERRGPEEGRLEKAILDQVFMTSQSHTLTPRFWEL